MMVLGEWAFDEIVKGLSVSILLVMDDGLGAPPALPPKWRRTVSILLVMDDGLGARLAARAANAVSSQSFL